MVLVKSILEEDYEGFEIKNTSETQGMAWIEADGHGRRRE